MAFGQDFLQGFFGNEYLKDYRHAAKTFRTNGYENSPRFKYLFHVYFNLNTNIPGIRNIFSTGEQSTIGLLVKNIQLPRFQVDTETLIQYNRKRVIQKKINYQPVTTTFHDDGGDLIRTLWYNYFSYYYKDPTQKYGSVPNTNGNNGPSATQFGGANYTSRDIYDDKRLINDWGYIGESYFDAQSSANGKPAFFRDITIYGFNQHKWCSYVLINPLINSWDHDEYSYAEDSGIMENRMEISYETVKYYAGGIGGDRPDTYVQGFADPNYYDTEKSPLSRPGGTRSILGQGGLVDTGLGIIGDLTAVSQGRAGLGTVLGAVQKAGAASQTFKNANIKDVALEEALGGVKGVLRGDVGGVNTTTAAKVQGVLFPTPPKSR